MSSQNRLMTMVLVAAHTVNNMKGSIYMVFDYMDHDLTGLMQRTKQKLNPAHVCLLPLTSQSDTYEADVAANVLRLHHLKQDEQF